MKPTEKLRGMFDDCTVKAGVEPNEFDCVFIVKAAALNELDAIDEAFSRCNERTCYPVTEVLDSVDIGIGYLDRLRDNCSGCGEPLTADYSANTPERSVLPNYCYNCGAKVVG